ncbi:MAG: ATP-dependent DNA helicase PcrA, partial [Clostridiales bacterium]|nr:ATP-dependent DNA helicase PcrA [Clostridiales bacterium]
ALKRNAIPYKGVGGMKFFDRAEVKDMLAYLCVLNNPMDDLRLRRIINTPARGIGATTMDKVAELAAEQGASLYEIIRNADLFPTLKTAAGKLTKFADLIDGLRRAGGTLALPEFYDEVLNQTGYVRALEEKKDMESRGRIENVQELKSNILGFLEQDPEDATLSGFLNEIALYTDLDSVEADDNCVTMMTIHSAKGLEFPVVYVVGMEEGIFPGASAMYDEEELEEERRLCYVAMTRAREKLVMTNARQRMLYGRTSANKASRFLDEIPADDMRWESKPEPRFGASNEDGFGGSRWDDDFGGSSFGGSSYGSQRSASGNGYGGNTGYSGSTGRSGGYVSGGVHTYKSTRPTAQPLRTSSRGSAPSAPAVELIQLRQGDQVEHTAFGKGTVVSVKPMGGDALAEVAFEGGTKKLMLKSAGKHMKKL